MFVSEDGGQLYVHELSLSPKESFRRIMQLTSPEPDLGKECGMQKHGIQAIWAPDDTVVALVYSMEHDNDPRADAAGSFQVLISICATRDCSIPDTCKLLYAEQQDLLMPATQSS